MNMKRTLRWIAVAVMLAVSIFVGASWIFAQRLTRARPCPVAPLPADFPFTSEAVSIDTADAQTLSGWLIPAPTSTRAIVLLHGYSGTRQQMIPRARFLRALGYAVLIYDARACGESTGDAVTFGYRERHDVLAAVRFLRARGYRDIACLGVSQGGATILFAAPDLSEVKCVICESVYDEMTHAVDGRMRHYTGLPGSIGGCLMIPFAERRLGLAIDDVKPVEHVGKLRCPILIISGEKDDRTSPDDTRRLFDAAREPKELWMIPEARHQDLFHFTGYEQKVQSFLQRHFE